MNVVSVARLSLAVDNRYKLEVNEAIIRWRHRKRYEYDTNSSTRAKSVDMYSRLQQCHRRLAVSVTRVSTAVDSRALLDE